MTWNYLTSGFTEVVKTRRLFSCTLLYLDDAYTNLSPEKFTYFWQIEWDGLKSMKSETAQTLFFSDAFAPLSRCRRLALGTRTWPYLIPPWRRQQVKTLFTSFMSLIERSTQKQVFFYKFCVLKHLYWRSWPWLLWRLFTYFCRQGFIFQ